MSRIGIHFAAAPAHVHHQNGLGARSDSLFDARGIEIEGAAVAIHQDRRRPGVNDGVNGGAEGHRRRDHFVAGADSQRQQREMNCGRPAAYPGRIGCAFVAGELLLEALAPSRQADPVAAQALDDRSDLGLANHGRAEDQPLVTRTDGIAAGYRRSAVGFLNWM